MNGAACCILGVCCPPGSVAQQQALAHAMEEHMTTLGKNTDFEGFWLELSKFLIENLGLVPPKVMTTIIEQYKPLFDQAAIEA